MNTKKSISLLWQDFEQPKTKTITEETLSDLNMEALKNAIEAEYKIEVLPLLKEIPRDPQDAVYRQEVLSDFINHREVYQACLDFGSKAHYLFGLSKFAFEKEATVYNLIKRMEDVETVRSLLEGLLNAFNNHEVKSRGLKRYHALLQEIISSDIYDALMQDVKHIRSMTEGVKSLLIGLNLDEYLQPQEAILLELSSQEFKYNRFMKKLGYQLEAGINELKKIPLRFFAADAIKPPDPLNALEKTLEPATLQLIKFCDQFNAEILNKLNILHIEMPFYQAGLAIYDTLKGKGLPHCFPIWSEKLMLKSFYNINLAYLLDKEEVKLNHLSIEPSERITVLTGANRGGKTTLTQALGQILLLANLGLMVPAKEAMIPYVSQLLLHFDREETKQISYGRLGEECMRFKQLFDQSDADSLYLMNESFSGTSHQESLQISLETLRAVYEKGGRVIFNTHLHELVEALEKVIPKESILSLIAGRDMEHSPYLVERARPLGKSYALEIAQKYQMTYEQLMALKDRNCSTS